MPSALKFIGGGLLRGVGEALLAEGLEKRKRVRAQLLEDQKDKRQVRTIEAADTRQDRTIQAGIETAKTKAKRDAEAATLDETRKTSRERLKSARLSPKDAWDAALETGGLTDQNEIKDVDWKTVEQSLRDFGYPKLANAARRRFGNITDAANLKTAREQAIKELENEKTGFFSDDPTKAQIKARTLEIMGRKSGGSSGGIIDIIGAPGSAERRKQFSDLPVGGLLRAVDPKTRKVRIYRKLPNGQVQAVQMDDPLAGASDTEVEKKFRGQPNLN